MIPKTEAIVLKSFDYRETSRIVTFFTKDCGKITAIMKGVRKDPRKFGSSVEKYSVNDLVYYHYTRTDLHLVSQCDLKQFFFPIRDDYARNVAANYALELVNKIMPAEETNQEVYQLLHQYLECLQDERDIERLIGIFQIKILQNSGFSPHLDSCVKCEQPVKGKVRFTPAAGGLICPKCPSGDASFTLISQGAISTIIHIESQPWQDCLRLGLAVKVRAELKYILNNFLEYHLEQPLRSSKYLN